MTAYESGPETVFLGREMGGDLRKDLRRNAIDVDERVPPFADIRQRGRGIPVELKNLIGGKAMEQVSVLLSPTMIDN